MALSIYRNHVIDCQFKKLGRRHTDCQCPISIYSRETGTRSLRTNDWATAMKKLSDEQSVGEISPHEWKKGRFDHAVDIFLHQKRSLAPNTLANYKCALASLSAFFGPSHQLDSVTVESMDRYRDHRGLSQSSWMGELTIIRNFFGFCLRRGWCRQNPAKLLETPRGVNRSRSVEPYSAAEIESILYACGALSYSYDRRRGLAAIRLMLEVGLRVCDVSGLRKDSVSGGKVALRARKNDRPIRLPVSEDLQAALDDLPNTSDKFYFWRGRSKRQLERLLGKVFRKAGVSGATPHRFRHTLATRMLERGATLDDVADVLGDTPDTVRKHYAKWTPAREERLGRLLL